LKLLLDTHIWLWLIYEPSRLGRNTLQQLQDTQNELWLSPISVYEALTLHEKGRLQLESDLDAWLLDAARGTREAPLTHEIAFVARRLPLHQDPSDRIIAATAQVMNLTLVTADARLLGLGNIRILGNR
jgi:PIN domain nuclease of toxin-antitoxin system